MPDCRSPLPPVLHRKPRRGTFLRHYMEATSAAVSWFCPCQTCDSQSLSFILTRRVLVCNLWRIHLLKMESPVLSVLLMIPPSDNALPKQRVTLLNVLCFYDTLFSFSCLKERAFCSQLTVHQIAEHGKEMMGVEVRERGWGLRWLGCSWRFQECPRLAPSPCKIHKRPVPLLNLQKLFHCELILLLPPLQPFWKPRAELRGRLTEGHLDGDLAGKSLEPGIWGPEV